MTKVPSVTAFDGAMSWAHSDDYTTATETTTEEWKLRGAFLEGKVQAQTTIFQDMLGKLETENKKLSEKRLKLAAKRAILEGKIQAKGTTHSNLLLAKLEAENKMLSASLDASREEKQELVKRCGYLEGILEGKVRAQTAEVQDRLAKLEAENKELSEQKQNLAAKANKITASLDAAREESKELMEKVDRLVQEQESVSTQYEAERLLSASARTEIKKLSAEKNELASAVQRIKGNLFVSQEENNELTEKLNKLVEEKDALSNQVEEFRKKYPVWKTSLNEFSIGGRISRYIDVLNGPTLHSGKTKWKIAVHNRYNGMFLGVVSARITNFLKNYYLGFLPETWGYWYGGNAWFGGEQVGGQHYPYGDSSVVTFLLDLTGQGTLSVAVDDKPLVKLFGNMKSVATEFIPAVNLCSNSAKVEFLGFE